MAESNNMMSTDTESGNEILQGGVFTDNLLHALAAKLAAHFKESEVAQDGTQALSFSFDNPDYGLIEISDYYNRAHSDERVRSYLRKHNLDNQHLLIADVDPIINFAVDDIQYAVFKPKDIDPYNGIGQLLTGTLPVDLDPEKTIVIKSLKLLEKPEDDPMLQWLST